MHPAHPIIGLTDVYFNFTWCIFHSLSAKSCAYRVVKDNTVNPRDRWLASLATLRDGVAAAAVMVEMLYVTRAHRTPL